ncbi:SGNH/GDSL hydrolase family protein [Desulfopila sp. IMCC35008]|uniref:SGNH/GDSL hydrolase family protein n=1 Tax=Desulfopila sp. IMCC35008 TaxID=2653858 RepID=UPI0013D0960B|nr:SGNH/GDSL hydrolase family protein [Desulfopila sp. IMCC35008]
MQKIVAIGDCNTLGAGRCEKRGYPEKVAERLGAEIVNRGHTMATSREGIHLLKEEVVKADCVLIQFGLVDSYKTFKYSPYVLYYPDNFIRKNLRALTKKYKKICRNQGLNKIIGEVNVVPAEEYEHNIRSMVELASPRKVVLIDTVPNKQLERNGEIQRYNGILDSIAADYPFCTRVKLYADFIDGLDTLYADPTHCNNEGYEKIAEKIVTILGN